MNAPTIYKARWPLAIITGKSDKHVSVALFSALPYPDRSPNAALAKVEDYGVPKLLWDFIHQNNPGVTWYVSFREFRALMLYDMHSILTAGYVKSLKDDHLKNPNTGNKYHRLGEVGGFVVGVRFFIFDKEQWDCGPGFRVRFELATNEGQNECEATRAKIDTAVKEVEAMPFLNIPEPPSERQRGGDRVPEQGQ